MLEFVSAGSVLVWDDVPLETSIAAKHTVTMDGATPVHTVIYDLAALVPLSLQSSGPHKLSFVNSGINAEETVLEPVTVFDPVPHIDAVYPIATSAAALTIGVNGTGFMPGSIVEWDGVPHAARYASSTLMELLVPSAELVGGAHPIVVRNPTSGPSNAMVYTVTPAGGGTGIVVRHALFRTPDNRIGDFITFSNGGSTTVDQLEIRSIKLHVGAGGYSVNLPMPQAIPAITPGEAGSLVVMFPAVGTPGQTAEIRIRALLNGKTVSFDLPVVLPN